MTDTGPLDGDDRPLFASSGGLAVPAATAQVARRQWEGVGAAGTWWTGAQRVAIAENTLASRRGAAVDDAALDDTARRAISLVAAAPHRVDRAFVDGLEADGLDRLAYTEIVGVVARVTAIATAARGLGAELPAPPAARSGEPDRATSTSARQRSAFVPMAGGAGATTALSAVAREDRDQEELHGALYLSYAEMANMSIVKGLHRAQMETVAARTSLINECHF